MDRDDVIRILHETATLMELAGEDSYRVQAYHNAARLLEPLPSNLLKHLEEGNLRNVRGIGESMLQKIETILRTGSLPALEELRAQTPQGLLEILRIQGLGPKKVRALHNQLGITTLSELKKACEEGKVAELKGFGEKSQQKILEGIAFLNVTGQRVRIDEALPLGLILLERLKKLPNVIRAELCGSLRRRKETSKDIDILISSDNPRPIMEAFVSLPEVVRVTGHGETKSSVVAALQFGSKTITLPADLRIVTDDVFPFALHHFTGSKEHNIRMRSLAQAREWSLSEYGLATATGIIPCQTEQDIFQAFDMEYIPPELREDTGEIESALAKNLPRLVERHHLRGVFHNHTTYSDGSASLEDMALACKNLGLEYFGVGDHSQSLKIARGMSPETALKQIAEIDRVNQKLKGIQILKGIECDILEDGSLDYESEFLKNFDYVVASVHTHFNMSSEEMTARICKALQHPATTILGHPTGRLLLRRDAYKVDLDEVLRVAAQNHKWIEINANPYRLDLDWQYVKKAKELGIPIVINPDAHSPEELSYVDYGIDVARRGWLEPCNVWNTKSLDEITKILAERKK
jgi:DNA polymerase (family 10)